MDQNTKTKTNNKDKVLTISEIHKEIALHDELALQYAIDGDPKRAQVCLDFIKMYQGILEIMEKVNKLSTDKIIYR